MMAASNARLVALKIAISATTDYAFCASMDTIRIRKACANHIAAIK